MDIKPIKNERDYRRVLTEIESLMDAKANTADGDKLDVLATLAEAWEKNTMPSKPLIQFRRLSLRWSSAG